MDCEFEAQVRELAYQNWEKAGCPPTTQDERNRFWFEAEQIILKKREDLIHAAISDLVRLEKGK